MNAQQLAKMIDHTILKAEATPQQVDEVCDQASEYGFYSVCVNPIYVSQVVKRLSGTTVKVASVAGFPLGCHTTQSKVADARQAIESGAHEIDMVLHVGGLIAGEKNRVGDDIAAVADAVHAASSQHLLKVILETSALNENQIAMACRCCAEAQADFVKTSTGFHPTGGANPDAVRLLKRYASPIKVKASGGIRDYPTALAMIQAGADRLGCSASVAIVKEAQNADTTR